MVKWQTNIENIVFFSLFLSLNRYAVCPSKDINFGPIVLGSKKTRTFLIENKGEFDFRYVITKRELNAKTKG